MQIDAQELERRLNSPKNLVNTVLVPSPAAAGIKVIPQEPRKNTPQVTDRETRILAGALAAQGESCSLVARELGLTEQQVHSAKYSQKPEIKEPIRNITERVRDLAIEKLMLAMGLMTEEKFDGVPLKDLSLIAANMSRVVEKMSARDAVTNNFQLHIYAPQQRTESHYKTVDI
jgi:DNA-binding CsgD family transcriptional regulator